MIQVFQDGVVKCWDMATDKLKLNLKLQLDAKSVIQKINLSPCAQYLSIILQSEIKIFNLKNGLREIISQKMNCQLICWSRIKTCKFVLFQSTVCFIYEDFQVKKLNLPYNYAVSAIFDKDDHLIWGSQNGQICI